MMRKTYSDADSNYSQLPIESLARKAATLQIQKNYTLFSIING